MTLPEFEQMLTKIGFNIVEDVDVPDNEGTGDAPVVQDGHDNGDQAPEQLQVMPAPMGTLEFGSEALASALAPVTHNGSIDAKDLHRALQLLEAEKSQGSEAEFLHWSKTRELCGIGTVLKKCNHIAIIVSDVGRSAQFYSDVVGLEQIRRPNFDRHGAWFTMGNLELHLIKGQPLAPVGDHLIIGHVALEVTNIDRVPEILKEKGIPFKQNVSVPKGVMVPGSGTNDSNNSQAIVKQYFFRDPDGYYLEVCNCQVLDPYCLGSKDDLSPPKYDEGVRKPASLFDAQFLEVIALRLSKFARIRKMKLSAYTDFLHGAPFKTIASSLHAKAASKPDEELLEKLLVRRTVYGDVCQNVSVEELNEIVLLSGNNVTVVEDIISIHIGFEQTYRPPAFFLQGEKKFVPEPFSLHRFRSCVGGHEAAPRTQETTANSANHDKKEGEDEATSRCSLSRYRSVP